MTIFDELAKLAMRFRSIRVINGSTDLEEMMDLVEQALRFAQRAEDLCSEQGIGPIEIHQVRARALDLQHCLRKLQTHNTLKTLQSVRSDMLGLKDGYEALFDACRTVCAVHNCILVDWWEAATSHA